MASRYGCFPILVETYRECLSDVFDLPALREILAGVARREIVVHSVETAGASPFASSLLFDYVAAYMYDGDTPLAERRAGALTLDRELLRELLGQEELRELLDPDALADLELSLQALTEDRQATTLDGVHDLLRRLGDLAADEVAARTDGGAGRRRPWLAELAAARRAVRTRIAGEERWIAIEDVARYRDGVGIAPPVAYRRPSSARRSARSTGCSRAGPGRTVRSWRPSRRAAGVCPAAVVGDGARTPAGGRRRCCAASSDRAGPSASGATRRCCGCSAGVRWPGSDARSSRSTRRAGAIPARVARGRGSVAARTGRGRALNGWPRSSSSWPGWRSRRPCWNGTCCRRACPATSRGCSTSWARSVR